MKSSQNRKAELKPGSQYIRRGKILGFFALITIPSLPLYAPLFCYGTIIGVSCGMDTFWLIIPATLATVTLGVMSITTLIKGWRLNKSKK